jgi:hypothetical protein
VSDCIARHEEQLNAKASRGSHESLNRQTPTLVKMCGLPEYGSLKQTNGRAHPRDSQERMEAGSCLLSLAIEVESDLINRNRHTKEIFF